MEAGSRYRTSVNLYDTKQRSSQNTKIFYGIQIYNTADSVTLPYGSENWTKKAMDENRITISEMRSMRTTAKHAGMNCKKREDILKEKAEAI
jgi:hypothetical protein